MNNMKLFKYDEVDERGQIPEHVKRGVLSQDAVYNLLTFTSVQTGEKTLALIRLFENKTIFHDNTGLYCKKYTKKYDLLTSYL